MFYEKQVNYHNGTMMKDAMFTSLLDDYRWIQV